VLTPPPLYAPFPVGFDPHVIDTVMATDGLIAKVAHDTGAGFIDIHKVMHFCCLCFRFLCVVALQCGDSDLILRLIHVFLL
jgi:hypothetical protein